MILFHMITFFVAIYMRQYFVSVVIQKGRVNCEGFEATLETLDYPRINYLL